MTRYNLKTLNLISNIFSNTSFLMSAALPTIMFMVIAPSAMRQGRIHMNSRIYSTTHPGRFARPLAKYYFNALQLKIIKRRDNASKR